MAKKFVRTNQSQFSAIENKDVYKDSIVFVSDGNGIHGGTIVQNTTEYGKLPTNDVLYKDPDETWTGTDVEGNPIIDSVLIKGVQYLNQSEQSVILNNLGISNQINKIDSVPTLSNIEGTIEGALVIANDTGNELYKTPLNLQIESGMMMINSNLAIEGFEISSNWCSISGSESGLSLDGSTVVLGTNNIYLRMDSDGDYARCILMGAYGGITFFDDIAGSSSLLSLSANTIILNGEEIAAQATEDILGGIKTGYTENGQNYKVQTDAYGNAYVNVPNEIKFAVCQSNSSTKSKTVSVSGISQYTNGLTINIKFLNGNTADEPTLNINGLGPVEILWNGANISTTQITAYNVYTLIYDNSTGTGYWRIIGGVDHRNTTGATATTSKLYIVGATNQGENPQTYTNEKSYIGTDGILYSGGYNENVSANIANKVITGTPQLFAPINLQRKVYAPLQYNDGAGDGYVGESRHAINYIRVSGDYENDGTPINLSSPITIVEVSNYTGDELWLNIPKLAVAEYEYDKNTSINPYTNVDTTKFRTSRKVIIYFLGESATNVGYIGFTSASGDPSVNIHSNSIYTNGEFAQVDTDGVFFYHPYLRKLECDILLDVESYYYQVSATSHIIIHS